MHADTIIQLLFRLDSRENTVRKHVQQLFTPSHPCHMDLQVGFRWGRRQHEPIWLCSCFGFAGSSGTRGATRMDREALLSAEQRSWNHFRYIEIKPSWNSTLPAPAAAKKLHAQSPSRHWPKNQHGCNFFFKKTRNLCFYENNNQNIKLEILMFRFLVPN